MMLSKYFSKEELNCKCGKCDSFLIDPNLLTMLDELRGFVGIPLNPNSGYRCLEYNRSIGSEDSSAHVKGHAVDLRAESSTMRFLVIKYALLIGFRRIGIGKDFIHLDNDKDLPQQVIWLY